MVAAARFEGARDVGKVEDDTAVGWVMRLGGAGTGGGTAIAGCQRAHRLGKPLPDLVLFAGMDVEGIAEIDRHRDRGMGVGFGNATLNVAQVGPAALDGVRGGGAIGRDLDDREGQRSEESRVGKECVRWGSTRWGPDN